jgi:hypothetical protein
LLLGTSLVAIAGGAPAASASVIQGVPWPLRAAVPAPGYSSDLYGVYCVTAGDCWAVGQYTKHLSATSSVTLNQVLHWNGRTWSTAPAPSPGGTAGDGDSSLASVRCATARDCWAVGFYEHNNNEQSQALHWNGLHWSIIATPSPARTVGSSSGFNALISVTCPGVKNCWAVGQTGKPAGSSVLVLNEVLHWNGAKWTSIPAPSPGGTKSGDESALESVRCTSPGNCWAAGVAGSLHTPDIFGNEMLHWNGSKWSTVHVPNPGGSVNGDIGGLNGLACTSAANCWAVGNYGTLGNPSTFQNQALHWDGHHWSLIHTPQPDGTGTGASNGLDDVTCTAAANCWAVGSYGSVDTSNMGSILNQVLHWNGLHWSLVASPDPVGLANGDASQLSSIRCATARFCWAVGFGQAPGQAAHNQALRWNGSKWIAG